MTLAAALLPAALLAAALQAAGDTSAPAPAGIVPVAAAGDTSRVPTPFSLGGDEVEELPVAPAAVESVFAADVIGDAGRAIDVRWSLSADDTSGTRSVIRYEVLRSASEDGPFETIASVAPRTSRFRDGRGRPAGEAPRNGTAYHYRVRSVGEAASSESPVSAVAVARGNLLTARASVLSLLALATAAFFFVVVRIVARRVR